MVTRPRDQSAEITSLLEKRGATVIHCPTIRVIEPDDWGAADAAIKEVASYDWVVFTSANGVRFFVERLAAKHAEGIQALARAITCAIGPATAKAMETAGLSVDVVAADSRAEGALAAIVERAGGEQKVRGLRLLIPRARVGRELLPVELSRLGARVDAVEVYQTVRADIDAENIIGLFNKRAVDAVTFTSPSTVSNFAALVGASDLSSLLENAAIACIGPTTSRAAAEFGLTKIIQPEVYTAAAMVEALARAIGQ